MDYAIGRKVYGEIEGRPVETDWEWLKNNKIGFVVINCSAGIDDSEYVAKLVEDADKNGIPAILETMFDPSYYASYGGAKDWPKNEEGLDEHVNAAKKGMLNKTFYEYWTVCTNNNNPTWNARAFAHFASHMRHILNQRRENFPMSIRISEGWYNSTEGNMTWLQFKEKWGLVLADWIGYIPDLPNPETLNHGTWEYMEYAEGEYIFNGTVKQLYDRFKFVVVPPVEPPPVEPPPVEPPPIADRTFVERFTQSLSAGLDAFVEEYSK